MNRLGLESLVLNGVIGALAGYVLSVGKPMLALIAVIVSVPVNYFLYRAAVAKATRRGEVLIDEMHVSIAEKAGLQVLRLSMIAIALILIVVLWPSYFNMHVVPREITERLYPRLGLSFAILTILYTTFYVYYIESKKVIEW